MYTVGYVKDRISNESYMYQRENYFPICWHLNVLLCIVFQISKSFTIILAFLFNTKHHLLSVSRKHFALRIIIDFGNVFLKMDLLLAHNNYLYAAKTMLNTPSLQPLFITPCFIIY